MTKTVRYTLLFIGAFLILHALSLLSFFVPVLQPVFFFIFLGAAVVFAFWKPTYAPIPIILELLLDSSGHLFEWRDLSLRLLVLVVCLLAWLFHTLRVKKLFQSLKTPFTAVYMAILVIIALAAYNGLQNGHAARLIIADAIPFLYLALFYPLRDLFKKNNYQLPVTGYRLLLGSFLGAAILSIIALFLFSSGLQEIHGPFYIWWRDWVAGKATATGNGFYRIVTPLHLFLTALIPYFVYQLLHSVIPESRSSAISGIQKWFRKTGSRVKPGMTCLLLLLTILLVPAINFSRIYFLAIIPAVLVMAFGRKINNEQLTINKIKFKKALVILLIIGFVSIAEYSVVNLAASRGQSIGFEFLYGQSKGIVDPESEASASARAAILPHLLDKIKTRPLIGEGMGATVTFYHPFLEKETTSPHLDWGYLEMAVEYGLIAVIFFLALLALLFWRLRQNPLAASALVFLAVVTITAPALFHVYGISLITVISVLSASKPPQN